MPTQPGESVMWATMQGQAEALASLIAEPGPVGRLAERLSGRRVLVIGTGTSWHAAEQGAWLLRHAGTRATAAQSADAALDRGLLDDAEVVIALSHTGTKRFTGEARALAAERGIEVVRIGGVEVADADLHTVARERSAAYTASHLAALLRMAQLAEALGAELGPLTEIPKAVETVVQTPVGVAPPARLIEFTGAGINQWTAAEGALKIREAAYVASEGLSLEQFLHGPSVALRANDHLVCLDGGGPLSSRIGEIAGAAERSGVPVTTITDHRLSEPLSIFPLTAAVQRIALESAESLGTNPDSFGRDVPGREPWTSVSL
ncbi:SIS domain-containing protein [Pseudonocardia acaciae]|uniref:SIS domain-containing protein n=1 Tax=Pseudonocardia acaciae TaxID=551276 RepID=UPI00048C0F1C|nr:SIS domain-containing protein [Pseudonocardia acaciae]